jgi:N-formylglutamate deformylase
MTDQEFVAAFETCTLPNEDFHHRDHLRLAWIYLEQFGLAKARERLAESIRRYALYHGKSEKYHHTVTIAWLQLIEHAVRGASGGASFEDVLKQFPGLLNRKALDQYYSAAALGSPAARTSFVPPDKEPLPESLDGVRS